MKKRQIYLDNTPLDEALVSYIDKLHEVGAINLSIQEVITVDDALHRVTAEPIYAKISSPHYNASAMDGMAVSAIDTFGASETTPVQLQLGGQAFPVDTGDPLPDGCNAVVMIEDVHIVNNQVIEIIAAVAPWQHVRTIGEDIVTTEMILPANHTIRPFDLGGILAGGVTEIAVRKKPKVAVMPTGTELVQPGQELHPGDIIEFNSRMIGATVDQWGGQSKRYLIVKDDYNLLKDTLLQALEESDMVIINAGSSAGSEDFTSSLIGELGQVITHGVAIKPGKPVILGIINNKPVIGLPGYPVSTMLTCEIFAKPVISAMQGLSAPKREKLEAIVSRRVMSPMGVDEFVRVKLGQVGDKMIATPISRGAGLIMSLVRADGITKVPRFIQNFEAGQKIEVELLRSIPEITDTTVITGSHDNVLDILANLFRENHPGRSLSSAHVGSMGGIMAIKRGEAHMAGIHLLDEESGEYNISYIQKLLPGRKVKLVNLTYRDQGLIVPQGNPKKVKGITDLSREDISIVNRQRGAGTRILLDFKLKEMAINPDLIKGYEREEYTHMAIAAAVASGSADTGLGILAAARALELDFVPIARERYDLLIPAEFWTTPYISLLLAIIKTTEFKNTVQSLGGYDLRDAGQVIYES